MDLHQHIFLSLCGDLAAGINFSPVKHSQVVQLAFGGQQFILTHGLASLYLCRPVDQRLARVFAAYGHYRRGLNARSFVDKVHHLESMLIVSNLPRSLAEGGVQKSQPEILRHDLIAVIVHALG